MIARLVGDGILAYFCYPVANENDPERAVRAALDIMRGIGVLDTPAGTALNVRIGIATGRVIVSDLFAGGQQDMPLDHRLDAQSRGAPAGLRAARRHRDRRRDARPRRRMFVCEDLGERDVRGFEQTHRAWRVIGEALPRPCDRAAAAHALLQIAKAELAILAERWNARAPGSTAPCW